MMELNEALNAVLSGIESSVKANGFTVVEPKEKTDGAPVIRDGEHTYIDFVGEKGKIRFEIFGNQALLFYTDVKGSEATDEDLVKASVNYFNLEEFDQRDIKSLCNELNETVNAKFGSAAAASAKAKKMPTPVSKTAAKNGAQAYDGNTLASRLCAIYPDLKEPYKANFEKYDEFLPEEFFVNYGAKRVINTISVGNASEIKRLFKILNDIYENGSSDVQGLIAVTILGEMNNDPELCQRAAEYMCDDMKEPVLLINKYFATSKGKRAKAKLENPPAYKPKKEKKPGMFAQMMNEGMAQNGGMPPM